jgi:anti-anti-sigma factor
MNEAGRKKDSRGTVSSQEAGRRKSRKPGAGNVAGIVRDGAGLRLAVGVKLTAAEASDLQAALKKEIAGGAKDLVFDLKETVTLDSTGIGLLVAAGNSLAAAQGSMRLVNVSDDILKLLRSMRLTDRLHASAEEGEMYNG